MKKIPYRESITEFIDWVSGENSITGNIINGVDSDHPISGESIRKLL